jgi:hypothetical protein
MAVLAAGMIGISILHFVTGSGQASSLTTNDPRFVLYAVLVAAMGYYAWAGFTRSRNPALDVEPGRWPAADPWRAGGRRGARQRARCARLRHA